MKKFYRDRCGADWGQTMSVGVLGDYVASREAPWLIHYCGPKKPWNGSHVDPLSAYFWEYARRTEFYEEIVFDYCEKIISGRMGDDVSDVGNRELRIHKDEELRNILKSTKKLPSLKRKLKRIRFRLLYTFGAKRGKLKMRKAELKRQIRNARAMIQKL